MKYLIVIYIIFKNAGETHYKYIRKPCKQCLELQRGQVWKYKNRGKIVRKRKQVYIEYYLKKIIIRRKTR